jgi:hypothetical protein
MPGQRLPRGPAGNTASIVSNRFPRHGAGPFLDAAFVLNAKENWKMKEFEHIFESFRPITQFLITCGMGILAHLDKCASVLALAVLVFQFKVVYYNAKLKKIEYEKECKEA